MTETKYLVKNQKEYDFIAKKLDKKGKRWLSGSPLIYKNLIHKYPYILISRDDGNVCLENPDLGAIKVSDLMKNKDVIYMTPNEKAEFDELKDNYTVLYFVLQEISEDPRYMYLRIKYFSNNNYKDNKAQLEFARAWADPNLIVIKDEPRFAYKLKDWIKPIFKLRNYGNYIYLNLNGDLSNLSVMPQYQTAKEWQAVDNEIKQIFDRVAEK